MSPTRNGSTSSRPRRPVREARTSHVATALGISGATVQRLARDGVLPYEETTGGHRRFNIKEAQRALERFEEKQRRRHFIEVIFLRGRIAPAKLSQCCDSPEGAAYYDENGKVVVYCETCETNWIEVVTPHLETDDLSSN